jgi:hypothetical protein
VTAVSSEVFWSAVSEILTVVVRGPRESPGERARDGHKPRSPDVLGVASYRRTCGCVSGYPVASAMCIRAAQGQGFMSFSRRVLHMNPCPWSATPRLADAAGYPRSW